MKSPQISPSKAPRLLKLSSRHTFRYRFGFIRNGVRTLVTPWRENLILDSGLNKFATVKGATCWNTCLFGNQVSPDPVKRNSGAITFTTVGTACTASGGFFVAQDVGRLIKFDDAGGQERYITAFTSSTLVTLGVAPSPDIAGDTATIWYVNQTALQSLFATTSTYGSNGGDNGTSVVGNVITQKRTFVGAAVGAPVSLTEIGFNNSTSNVLLFDRDIIVGGVGLITGDQPTAIAELISTWEPDTSTAVGNVGTGFDSSGDMIISGLSALTGETVQIVGTNGVASGAGVLEPSSSQGLSPITATFTLPAFSNGAGPALVGPYNGNTTLAGYSNGTFFRDCSISYGITEANGTLYGVGMIYNAGFQACWMQKYTTPFTKLNTQTLVMTTRKSWQRVLVN